MPDFFFRVDFCSRTFAKDQNSFLEQKCLANSPGKKNPPENKSSKNKSPLENKFSFALGKKRLEKSSGEHKSGEQKSISHSRVRIKIGKTYSVLILAWL